MTDVNFTVEDIRKEVKNRQKNYAKNIIQEIEELIKSTALRGDDWFYYTFIWDEGDYSEIINKFEALGFKFVSPSGPWEGGSTTFVVDISVVFE